MTDHPVSRFDDVGRTHIRGEISNQHYVLRNAKEGGLGYVLQVAWLEDAVGTQRARVQDSDVRAACPADGVGHKVADVGLAAPRAHTHTHTHTNAGRTHTPGAHKCRMHTNAGRTQNDD